MKYKEGDKPHPEKASLKKSSPKVYDITLYQNVILLNVRKKREKKYMKQARVLIKRFNLAFSYTSIQVFQKQSLSHFLALEVFRGKIP